MTIIRTKPNFALGDKLTSDEVDAIDTNVTNALDKRAGQTDTLASDVLVTGDTTFAGETVLLGSTTFDSGGDLTIACPTEVSANVELVDEASIIVTGATAKIAAAGAGATIRSESGGRIELGDNDYPQLATGHTGRTVTRVVTAGPFVTASKSANTGSPGEIQTNAAVLRVLANGTTSFLTVDAADATQSLMAVWFLDSVVPSNSTITGVTVSVLPPGGHAGLPAWLPRLRVTRMKSDGSSDSVMHTSGSNIVDPSASTGAYQALHALTAICDTANVVDKTQYRYVVAVNNEGGTNAILGMFLLNCRVTYTITDLRPH